MNGRPEVGPEGREVGEELVALAAACDLEQSPPLHPSLLLAQRLATLGAAMLRPTVLPEVELANVVERHVARRFDFEATKASIDRHVPLVLHRIESARRCLNCR